MKKLGVVGTMIWDTFITGRSGLPREEWGGIGYALAALDAALPDDWKIVPLVKVGADLAPKAAEFLRGISAAAPGSRFVEVTEPNPRVTLAYIDNERRCEGLKGGVPPWTWEELGPLTLGLDALYCNFITGFETNLETMRALRHAFKGPIYGDIHSLALGRAPDGTRYYRPVDEALHWLTAFDVAQVNEDEMAQLGAGDPFEIAGKALLHGTKSVVVTLGPRGAVYFTKEGGSLVKTSLVAVEGGPVEGDPTGCGDVFGGTLAARLLAGAEIETAIRDANRAARRNVSYRGASGLQHHLRGALQELRA